MRRTIYIIILALVILLMSATNVRAQKVYDVFSNEYLPVSNSLYKEVSSRNSIFNNKIEVLYFKIKNEDSKAIKSINKQAYTICLNYIIDDKLEISNSFNNFLITFCSAGNTDSSLDPK